MSKITNIKLPWGSLTGIRPTKLIYERSKMDKRSIIKELTEVYGVAKENAELLLRITDAQRPYIQPEKDAVDIYIGIPFCKTRCIYCSFASVDATQRRKLNPRIYAFPYQGNTRRTRIDSHAS